MYRHTFLMLVLAVPLFSCGGGSEDPQKPVGTLVKMEDLTGAIFLERLKDAVTCDWLLTTVDNFKEGDANQKITGIATTFLATQDVLEKAKNRGLNLIVTHEPTFYNHLDDRDFFMKDKVYEDKMSLIREADLMVFRFHDHWHRTQPDGIHLGMVDRLGWKSFQNRKGEMIFKLPETTLGDLALYLKDHFGASAIRAVGPKDMLLTKVGVAVGAPGYQSQIRMLRNPLVEVLVGGETHEWETVEYVRDAQSQGKKKALILIGHANSEEGGMAYCAEWLKEFISEVPIVHIPAGDPLWSPR